MNTTFFYKINIKKDHTNYIMSIKHGQIQWKTYGINMTLLPGVIKMSEW